MTPIQAYDSFIIKVNENAQTDNIATDRGRFVKLYNEASEKYVEWVLEKKNEDEIRYLNPVLITKTISDSDVKAGYQLFDLPSDFFDLGSVTGKATTECCKSVDFDIYEVKVDNEGVILNDELSKPDAEYREAPYHLENKKVKIYTDNFKVDNIRITYYKYPQYIELIDESDPESEFKDGDKELEFDNKVINRIISIAALSNSLNTGQQRAQLDINRVVSKF